MTKKPVGALMNSQAFVSILTVLPEYGNAPFLWIVTAPEQGAVGPNLCDGTYWDETHLMTEGLWQKYSDWAIEFDHAAFYDEDYDASDWDWDSFHERGLQLTRWLKEEVGDTYRVIYMKPAEDPNSELDGRREILANGTWLELPPLGRAGTQAL